MKSPQLKTAGEKIKFVRKLVLIFILVVATDQQ
jgi:hypothetical protein